VAERPVRILVADDSASDIFLVRRSLEQQGISHDLRVAHDGEEAMLFLNQTENDTLANRPHLILLDLNLPKVDGSHILSYIRRTPAFDATIVIVCTTSDSPQDRDLARELGANAYFQKPSDLRSFMRLGKVVEDALAARAG
jgi:chemotaxis family two-component system response regulator Rcp1